MSKWQIDLDSVGWRQMGLTKSRNIGVKMLFYGVKWGKVLYFEK